MVNLNITDDYFEYINKHPECKVVVYGAGNMAKENYKYMGHIDFFCDRNAQNIGNIEGIPCLLPEKLLDFNGNFIVLICIKQKSIVSEICKALEELNINAEVFYFFENKAFPRFENMHYKYVSNIKDKLKIRIICSYDNWIFEKFACKLQNELSKEGHEVEINKTEDPEADVNHYISYTHLTQFCPSLHTVRTTMITHIDCLMKKDMIKFQAQNNAVGICMSSDTMNKLSQWGVPRDKLCYVNPAQDGIIKPRKIVLGITNRCYGNYDFRKRDDLILEVCEHLSPQYFRFKIMGSGWNEIVKKIKRIGFEVDYYEEFDMEIYKELMPSLDYWLYWGFDEGAMGYLDALAAGVKTIATPQGYHLDTRGGLTYPCNTVDDFVNVLKQIENEKEEIVDTVRKWTWENYAKKHLEIWQYLTRTKPLKELFLHQGEYMDGIFSLLLSDISLD